ncbi:hypothetical protein HELRODRAFT_179000 [Helobdella robusta]|uniref:Snf2 ATP coupling domain-containing protein n=1 Tax=Helobdella robusta TaxID=6412 RepID=T1FE12_HELRO|nr:hypothetical protein HELRODRAFT_179000 [Helobdella robusta]ESN95816.1 hypothetical protein HELRODRAFT_179000 [Helobdella robusta]
MGRKRVVERKKGAVLSESTNRKGIRKVGDLQYHTVSGDDTVGFTVDKLPYAIEIGLSYSNVQLTLERKISPVRDDHKRLFLIFAHDGSDFIHHPTDHEIDQDQVNFCLQFLKEQYLKLDQLQMERLTYLEEEKIQPGDKRKRKEVDYSDTLTEKQWLRVSWSGEMVAVGLGGGLQLVWSDGCSWSGVMVAVGLE